MKKLRLFLENFLVYGLGGIISGVIPLIMVPVITKIMPDTSYFGISDLSNTVVSFAGALAIMGMYDAMYRMFFEKADEEYKKDICSTALVFTVITSIVVCFVLILCRKLVAVRVFRNEELIYLVYITAVATLAGATNSIVAAPTRMQNKRKIYLVMNAVGPVLAYTLAVPLLLKGYYIIALPIAGAISSIISEGIFFILNRQWFAVKRFHTKYLKALLVIAIPLVPNFLIYWIFNSCDKLMIANILGTGATGIYSVGSKLGHASQLVYIAFGGGWQFFAFSTMNEEKQVESNSKIFEYLGVISFACTLCVFSLSKPLYQVLFTRVYWTGFIIAPYLFLAPLLQMLFQVASNQFLVIKKTWPNFFILSSGAVINVILNLWLIPKIGIEGAAIATLIGYVVSDIIVVIVLYYMKLMRLSLRFLISVCFMTGYILLWRFVLVEHIFISMAAAMVCCIIFILLYREDLNSLKEAMERKLKNNNSKDS